MKAERAFAAAAALSLLFCASPAAALCGDPGGDGFVTAADALATLRMAVGTRPYDRRSDGKPARGDGRITASDALEILRASVESRLVLCAGAGAAKAVVTTAPFDFAGAGGFARVDVATRSFSFHGGAITGDAVVRTPDSTPVVVNRFNWNSLQVLDTSKPALPTIKECGISDGINSNPQDIAIVSPDKGYVTAYGGPDLLVIDPARVFDPDNDPACEGIITGRIDLSGYDEDGIPQMDQMVLVGSELFVTLQLLDDGVAGLAPKQDGLLVVIDTNTDKVTTTIRLAFANPFGETKGILRDEFTGLLYLSGPGNTGTSPANLDDGGVEAIDPVTRQSKGMLLTGADIHRNIFDFVYVGTARAFAIVADADSNSIVELDLKKKSVKRTLLTSTALITDIEMTDSGELWAAYRGETKNDPSGLRIWRTSDGTELTAAPLALGQAPFTLAFLP